jgi:hypothetical protein
MSASDGKPPTTPPAHVRLARLEGRVATLEKLGGDDYAEIRKLSDKIDAHHLVMLDAVGQLARMLGGKLKP